MRLPLAAPAREPAPALHLPDAPTAGQAAALPVVVAGYQASAAQIDAALERGIGQVRAANTAQDSALGSDAASRVAEARAAAAAARSRVAAEAAQSVGVVAAAAASSQDAVRAHGGSAAAEADATLARTRTGVLDSGRARAERARQSAAGAAQTARADADAQAARARTLGAAKAAGPGGTDEAVRAARSAAARELSGETAGRIGEAALGSAAGIRAQGEQVAGAVTDLTAQVAGDLGRHRDGAAQALRAQEAQVAAAVAGTARAGGQAVGERREAATAAIDQAEGAAVDGLQRQAAQDRQALADAGRTAAQHLTEAADVARRELARDLDQAIGAFMARPADAGTSAEVAQAAATQVGVVGTQVATGIDGRSAELASAIEAGAGQVGHALQAAGDRAAAGLRTGADGAAETVRGAAAATTVSLTQTVAQSDATAASTVASLGSVLEGHVATAGPGLDDLLQQHEGRLGEHLGQVRADTAEPAQSLDARIDTAQQRAEERASRSWLGNQLADLWSTVTSPEFLVGLAVGLLVGAIIILSAGTATPFVIMAAGIAAGAAGAAAGTMTGNIRQGRTGLAVFDGVVRNALIGGLAGGVAAGVFLFGTGVAAGLSLTGTAATVAGFVTLEVAAVVSNTVANVASGRPWDENLLTAMLLAPLIELIAARLPGGKGRAPDGERPPGPQEPPPGPRRPGPQEEPAPGPRPEEEPAPRPRPEEEPAPAPDEDGPGPRPEEIPEGTTTEDVHIEDGHEPARRPGDRDVDPAICFPRGTLVATPRGRVPIESVPAGSLIRAFDVATGRVVTHRVLAVVRGSTGSWADVRLASETVRATPAHPFWVESLRAWVKAEELEAGMPLRRDDGGTETVLGVTAVACDEPEDTYNLSVEHAESYFVGAVGVLVHNITETRLAYLRRVGYRNYVLRDAAGRIYYSGMCRPGETLAGLQRRHGRNRNRFVLAQGDELIFMPGSREYGESRLLEHRTAVDQGTIIGRDGDNYRGNRQDPIDATKMPEYVEYEQVRRGCG